MNDSSIKYATWLSLLILPIIVMRLIVVSELYDEDDAYLIRQIIYVLSWVALLSFFHNYMLIEEDRHPIKADRITMRNLAIITMVACLAHAIVLLVYAWPQFSLSNMLNSAYYITEIIVCLLLGCFCISYWRRMQERIKRWEEMKERKHQLEGE